MLLMSDLHKTTIIKRETTEDGDLCLTFEVRAKGFAGVKEFNETQRYPIGSWVGCGDGWYKTTFYKVVDGAEVAIEARNDEWASRQQAIEDAGRQLWWFH